jgi:hypothetical protein
MKKIIFIISVAAAIVGCNQSTNHTTETNSPLLLLSNDAESILTFDTKPDPLTGQMKLNIDDWFRRNDLYNQITANVKSGKMKAYKNYPKDELTVDEFNTVLTSWDTVKSTPVSTTISGVNIARIRFHEKIEMDTTTNSIKKEILYLSFDAEKRIENSAEVVGYRHLFDVKLNNK